VKPDIRDHWIDHANTPQFNQSFEPMLLNAFSARDSRELTAYWGAYACALPTKKKALRSAWTQPSAWENLLNLQEKPNY